MTRAIGILQHAYFFQDLPGPVIEAIAAVCHPLEYQAGEVVFQEGSRGDRLYIVLTGLVQVWKNHGSPDASLLSEYGPGRLFGEMALVDRLPRSATALAMQHTELLYLDRQDFHGLVTRYPELAMSVMRSLSAIVRESNDSFVADLNHRNRELQRAYRQLEEAQQELIHHERLSSIGKMSDMILHDIRNPVAVLKGYATMLEQVADDPARVREFARRVSTEAQRLSHMAGELLDYARGEVRLDMSVVAPSAVIAAAVAYEQAYARVGGVSIETRIENDQPVVLDFDRVVRALLNLLDNARKACRAGGRIELVATRREGVTAFIISDDGEGMPPEVRARVFEPFYSRSTGGTGLGMMVVKNIVEAHGGSMEVSSEEGKGTSIIIQLPGTY
ncbi:MAG: GHKL domain-containing protein [Spirochaetaceae bacterium]|nr:MAG: GHKL domain-containing protein [Spirochaetaceae bacterium]